MLAIAWELAKTELVRNYEEEKIYATVQILGTLGKNVPSYLLNKSMMFVPSNRTPNQLQSVQISRLHRHEQHFFSLILFIDSS